MSRPDLALALGGVGWTALACLPVLQWLEANRVRPGLIATTGFATLPAALWARGMPACDIARCLTDHLPNRVFRRRNLMPLLSMIGFPLPNRGMSQALWRSMPLRRACARLFGNARLEATAVSMQVTLIDCLTGGLCNLAEGDIAAVAYASTALLPALPPLRINGRWLGDGSACHAAPLGQLLHLNVRHAIAVACSFPPPERYGSLVDQQFTLQAALQKAGLKTSALLALELLDGEIIVLAGRLDRPVDPFDSAIVPEIVAAGERELARSSEHVGLVLRRMAA